MITRTIKPQIFTTNQTILPDGFAGIHFKNIGNDTVNIYNQIQLLAGAEFDIPAQFAEQELTDAITINFAGVGTSPSLLVVKTYLK